MASLAAVPEPTSQGGQCFDLGPSLDRISQQKRLTTQMPSSLPFDAVFRMADGGRKVSEAAQKMRTAGKKGGSYLLKADESINARQQKNGFNSRLSPPFGAPHFP